MGRAQPAMAGICRTRSATIAMLKCVLAEDVSSESNHMPPSISAVSFQARLIRALVVALALGAGHVAHAEVTDLALTATISPSNDLSVTQAATIRFTVTNNGPDTAFAEPFGPTVVTSMFLF